MKIMRKQIDSVVVLEIEGDIVGSWVRKFQNQIENLKDTGTNKIIINLKKATSIDSFGISVILTVVKEGIIKIRFSNVGYRVREMFEWSGITDIYDNEEEALESFGVNLSQIKVGEIPRRRYTRKDTYIPMEFRFINQESEKILCNATITNISGGGALLEYIDCNSKFKKISIEELLHTELELAIPDSLELTGLRARVVRLNTQIEQIGLGAEFTKIPPGIREKIINFVEGN
jgi:anti-anti-sigma factor